MGNGFFQGKLKLQWSLLAPIKEKCGQRLVTVESEFMILSTTSIGFTTTDSMILTRKISSLNFAKGLLKYKVGAGYYQNVVRYYSSQNRSIQEQYLNLSLEEKQQFFSFLQHNVKPENAEYVYNYVYDNCATKIRDIAEELFPDRIEFDYSYAESNKSIRDLMDDYLDYQPWGEFAIQFGVRSAN